MTASFASHESMGLDELRTFVRDVPDFPKPGIVFRDLTPLLADGRAFGTAIARLAEMVEVHRPTAIVGVESRGFIFGATVALRLGLGFIPVRKPGKLPFRTRRRSYDLEYGSDGLEIHEDAAGHGARVVVVDDVLATGGTAAATCGLVAELGAHVVGAAFVIEIPFLEGRRRLHGMPADALLAY